MMRSAFFAWSLMVAVRMACGSETVTIGADEQGRQPQAAVDSQGVIHLTFGAEGSIFYTRSADAGATYEDPVEVAQLKALSLGSRRGPRIAVADDAIVVAAIGGSVGGGQDGDMLAWRSQDQGQTWQGPARVNDVDDSAREGLHALAGGPDGQLCCVWLDLRAAGSQIFGSCSKDGGATWSKNALVYQSPGGSVCECCHPSVCFDAAGTVHVMWRNSLDGNRDMYMASSVDGGATFTKATKLGKGSWPMDACPMDGGAVAVDQRGRAVAVWRRNKEVFLTGDLQAAEQRLGFGQQPWVAVDHEGVYAVWVAGPVGELSMTTSPKAPVKVIAARAQFPVVAASATGKGPVVIAWEESTAGGSAIRARVVAGSEQSR